MLLIMEINLKFGIKKKKKQVFKLNSSMTLLKRSCLFATGHEDGYVKIWNLEIGSYITLESKYILK